MQVTKAPALWPVGGAAPKGLNNRMPSQDTDYSRYTDAQLLDIHIQDHHNHAVYEERLRREKRAERRTALKTAAITLVVITAILGTLAFLVQYGTTELFVIWGVLGLLFLAHFAGVGRGEVK